MRSFDLVDLKTAEAEYFLSQIGSSKYNLYEVHFLFSAYLSAARSITFALQAVLKELEGFEIWYSQKKQILGQDKGARFFLEARNLAQKVGVIPIIGGAGYKDEAGKSYMNFFF